MDKFKMLSGEQLVIQGAKKHNTTLPEIGLKDVVPNGSWLEQKQVQTLLEARKHMIEVERIEKCGTLSHADWNEELNLAEVTKKAGGHWQYVGHNVGRQLYIHPEEALHLMELNCLQLKHNGVTVSIQQAYSLLLKDSISLVQYKVYASLSRLGYKVMRHTYVQSDITANEETKINEEDPSSSDQTSQVTDEQVDCKSMDTKASIVSEINFTTDCPLNNTKNAVITDTTKDNDNKNIVSDELKENPNNTDIDYKTDDNILSEKDITEKNELSNGQSLIVDIKEHCKLDDTGNVQMETEHTDETSEVSSSVVLCDESENTNKSTAEVSKENSDKGSAASIQNKIEMLSSRGLKPCDSDMVHQCFSDNLPDLYQKHIVTVKAPEEQYIPRNVFLNNTAYVLNIENLKLKSVAPATSSRAQTYSIPDEANAQHVRRIRSGYSNESAQSNLTPQFFPGLRFPQQTHYRPFNYWNQLNYNWAYQRPFFPSMPFRFQVFPRMQHMFRCFPSPPMFPNLENSDTIRRTRKRKRNNPKIYHSESIKKLALKLKSLVAAGNRQEQNIQALQRLIQTYNIRYEARLELTDQLDIIENEIILETIDLDDDEQSNLMKKKKQETNLYDENFNAVKQFSAKIKELEAANLLSARHRRAFSNVIRTFNKSYNADIYVDSNYEVLDRRHIVIASSSDSECAVEEVQSAIEDSSTKKSRKLRNPFYIMKQLSEKQSITTTSLALASENKVAMKKKFEYSAHLKNMFSKYWLPSEDDFGRAEVPCRNQIKNQMDHNEDFLYQFMRSNPVKFNNWLDAKIAYWQSCKETALKFEAHSQTESNIRLDSIIKPEDCTDLRSVLKKLSIIKANSDVLEAGSLAINFDVYNRDVPNFRKTSKPKPHFRVICIDESSPFPTAIEYATLHSKYNDDVSIVFAIVGISSIAYLQVNPVDLPIYIPTTNLP